MVLRNENYTVRRLNSHKTQNLHRIIIPQDDLYVITWETNFGEFPNFTKKTTISTNLDATDTSNGPVNDDSPPGGIFTDVDLESTGPHQNEDFVLTEKTCPDRLNDQFDDLQSSGGSDTIVAEVLDDENDDVIVDI